MLNFENISCLIGLHSRILNPLNFHQTKISNFEFIYNKSSLRYGQTPILYSHLFFFSLDYDTYQSLQRCHHLIKCPHLYKCHD